jgi:hypothetical protein
VNRVTAALALAACLGLISCGGDPGDEVAHAGCDAYGHANAAAAQERAQRAAEANDSYAALQRDVDHALSLSADLAADHNAGREISASQMDAYLAADKNVRADCADVGEDIGPLRP